VQELKDVLQAELKMLREDLHRVLLTLTERTQRAAKLEAKHETLCSKSVGVEGIDEARSEVQHISIHLHLALVVVLSESCDKSASGADVFWCIASIPKMFEAVVFLTNRSI